MITNEKAPGRTGTTPGAEQLESPKQRSQTSVSNARFDDAALADLRGRLADYLGAVGVELQRRGTRLVGRCPRHEDGTPSFSVFADGTRAGCFPCDWQGDVFALAQWLGRAATFREAVRHVADVLGRGVATTGTTAPHKPKPPAPPPPALTEDEEERLRGAVCDFSDAWHGGDPIIHAIAGSLGVSLETLRHAAFGGWLGLCEGRVWKGRRLPVWLCYVYASGLKWRRPSATAEGPRFDVLFGHLAEPWRMPWAQRPEVQTVFIAEGESDALALIEAGAERDASCAVVAAPGTAFKAAWGPLFAGKRVVLCLDMDEAGRAATAKVASILRPHAAAVLAWNGGGA